MVISSNYIFIQNRVSPGYSCNVWVQTSFIYMLCKSLCAFLSFFWINKITKFELFSKEASSSIKRKMKLKVNTRDSLFLFLLRSPCRLLGIIRIHEQVGWKRYTVDTNSHPSHSLCGRHHKLIDNHRISSTQLFMNIFRTDLLDHSFFDSGLYCITTRVEWSGIGADAPLPHANIQRSGNYILPSHFFGQNFEVDDLLA